MTWDAENVARLRFLRMAGLSFSAAARAMGITRNAAISAFKRHVEGKQYPRPWRDHAEDAARRRARRNGAGEAPRQPRYPTYWSERYLTETWADRKARRAIEARQ